MNRHSIEDFQGNENTLHDIVKMDIYQKGLKEYNLIIS